MSWNTDGTDGREKEGENYVIRSRAKRAPFINHSLPDPKTIFFLSPFVVALSSLLIGMLMCFSLPKNPEKMLDNRFGF